ncbi:restriction endonuclease subunit S [Bifidobacterium adolescentis]|uniref:restriction endonuclease subunit S n=1 Tax=Bifidobacterium adolescentis TaxID=1680 RepID=UPI000E489FBB|nr:restriction endonuclease subunit S [Bifidobacterium adolescentis]RHJ04029.1 restriction endonuclease subunit S [Bifidobacterium adolescentis]
MGEPKLRFKADDGSEFPDWEDKTLGELFTFVTEKNKDGHINNVVTNSAERGLVPQREYFDKDIAVDGNTKGYTVIRKGDFVYNPRKSASAPFGPFNIYERDEVGIVSPLYTCLTPYDDEMAPYLSWYFKTNRWHPYIVTHGAQSGARHDRVGMTVALMEGIPVLLPSLPEQRKISDFLSAVDAVIAAQQAEVDAWEQRKKGVMQKLFSQEVRFKADDGSEFPDWEEKTLGELCAPLTYGMNAAATKFDGENRYIRITDIDDETHALLPNDIVSPSGELDDKYLVKKGDILLARTGASTGKSYLYHPKDGKLFYAGFLIKAHVLPSSDDYFIYSQTFTDRYWKWVKTASMRSGQPGINANEYASYSFAVPSLPEQRKIADCLASMDEVIQKSKDELAKWRDLKKGLLQQMFV